MINDDVRHIIEPELREGEKLLWAEVVSQRKITEHLKDVAAETKYQRRFNGPLSIIMTFTVFIACTWASLTFYAMMFFAVFILCVFGYIQDLKPADPDQHDFPGGYALTNERFFTFDASLSSWSSQDASNLKSAYEETTMLRLKPVGSGFFKEVRLAYLASNYRTEKYINSILEVSAPV